MTSVSADDLHAYWEYREPSMKEVGQVVDRCARATMEQVEWGVTPDSEATATLRSHLERVRGHLPSWMSPDFWSVEYDITRLPSTPNMRVQNTAFVVLPTALKGRRVEFFPMPEKRVKAVLPHSGDLFVVGDDHLDAIIALGRLVQAKGKG
jgi:hypothetical protein